MRDLIFMAFMLASLLVAMRYPFIGLLLWAWFTLATPHQATYAEGIPWNLVIAGVTFISFFLHREFEKVRINILMCVLVFFGFWLWLSQTQSLDPGYSAEYFDRFVKILIFIFFCMMMVTTRLRFHALLWLFAIVMGFYGAKGGLYTILTLGQNKYFGLEDTLLFDNNHMGIALAATLPIFLYLQGQAQNFWVRSGIQLVLVLSVIAILGTHSRGALVGLVVFATFIMVRSWRNIAVGTLVLALSVPSALVLLPDEWGDRMATIQNAGEDESFLGRVDAWMINYKLALEHPLTGAGLRNPYQAEIAQQVELFREARAAHSIYFEILGGTGIAGLLIYLTLIGGAFFLAFRAMSIGDSDLTRSWQASFGRDAMASLGVFGVAAASVSMEMWEGYLLIVALISVLANLNKDDIIASPIFQLKQEKIATRAYDMKSVGTSYQHISRITPVPEESSLSGGRTLK